jgi:hypothetical protein
MKLSHKKSVDSFINAGRREIKTLGATYGKLTERVNVLVDAMAEAYESNNRKANEPEEIARIYNGFSEEFAQSFDPDEAKRLWNNFMTVTLRKSKAKGFKPMAQKNQDAKDGKGIVYLAVNLVKHVEKKPSSKAASETKKPVKDNGAGGDTQPHIKTLNECKAAMAAWVRQGIISEVQLLDMALSLFPSEDEMRKAFNGCGVLTKAQTATKVSNAVKRERVRSQAAFEAEKARLEERAKNAVKSAEEIKARA